MKHGVGWPKHFSWPHEAYRLPAVEVATPEVRKHEERLLRQQICKGPTNNACSRLCTRHLSLIPVTHSDRDAAAPIEHLKKSIQRQPWLSFPRQTWIWVSLTLNSIRFPRSHMAHILSQQPKMSKKPQRKGLWFDCEIRPPPPPPQAHMFETLGP